MNLVYAVPILNQCCFLKIYVTDERCRGDLLVAQTDIQYSVYGYAGLGDQRVAPTVIIVIIFLKETILIIESVAVGWAFANHTMVDESPPKIRNEHLR